MFECTPEEQRDYGQFILLYNILHLLEKQTTVDKTGNYRKCYSKAWKGEETGTNKKQPLPTEDMVRVSTDAGEC